MYYFLTFSDFFTLTQPADIAAIASRITLVNADSEQFLESLSPKPHVVYLGMSVAIVIVIAVAIMVVVLVVDIYLCYYCRPNVPISLSKTH